MQARLAVVIGGRGFIGKHLVRSLVDSGYAVRVVSRQAQEYRAAAVEQVRSDVSNPEAIRTAIAGASVVCSLSTGGGDQWADFERDIIQGAQNVANACLASGVRRLVYASSIAALYLGGKQAVDRSAGTDPQSERRSYYSRAKAEAEKLLLDLHHSKELPVVIVRPGVVMGPQGPVNHSGVGYWPCDIECIGWGRGTTPIPFVLVQDVAYAMTLACSTPGIDGRPFNLAGDVSLTAREFVSILRERSRRRFQFHPRSLWRLQAIEIAKWGLKQLARKPENAFPSYRDLKSRSLRSPIDCSAAKSQLGWAPNDDLEVFVRQAIEANLPPVLPGDPRLDS